MKANVIGMDGAVKGTIELPSVFATEYKPKLIKRASQAIQSAMKQPKGADPRAGKKQTALYIGIRDAPAADRSMNVERARLPRLRNRGTLLAGRVAGVPHAVGGTAAHPLKAWEIQREEINRKEKRAALASAIATTTMKELVAKRFIVEKDLPIVVEDALENIAKTKEALVALTKVGVGKDIESASGKVRKRAGKGKARGRVWKEKKSVLIVTSKNSPILKAARNLPGVDTVTVNSLNVNLLAPGAEAGRLTVWTKGAIEELGKEKKANVQKGMNDWQKAYAEKKVLIKKEEAKKAAIESKKATVAKAEGKAENKSAEKKAPATKAVKK